MKIFLFCLLWALPAQSAEGPNFDQVTPAALEAWKNLGESFKWPMTTNYIQQMSAEDSTNDSNWRNYLHLKRQYTVEERIHWFRAITLYDLLTRDESSRLLRVHRHLKTLSASERANRLQWMRQRLQEIKAEKVRQRVAEAMGK